MRSLRKSWIGIALAILFGISLFFFRGSTRYSNLFNSDNIVANISGTPISTTQFLRALELNIGQFAQMIGEELSGDQIRAFQIHQLVLQNLVNNAIFENEFDKINYILDKKTIAENTKKRFPNLYNNKNEINNDALNSFLRQQRLKIEDLVNIINYETREIVFDDLLFTINYPGQFSKKISLYNDQIRNIELIQVPIDKINTPGIDLTNLNKKNSDLLDFFNENSNNYMTDEKRDISYILIDKESYKSNFVPTENEILEYFNNNKNIFVIPEKRSFKQFNFKSKDEAENFKLNISGLSNEEIIKFSSDNNITFNEFNNLDKNQVLDDLSEAIFSLSKDEISNVITTALAHHIVILDKIILEKQPSLIEVSESIKNTLTNVQLDNFYNDLKQKINQQILNGYSIDELASENNLKVLKKLAINRNYINNNNDLDISIIESAFNQNKDFISDINQINVNVSFILNVDNIYPSNIENIDTIFEKLKADYIKSKKLEFAKNYFEKLESTNNLKNISDNFQVDIKNIDVQINSTDYPSSLVNNVFSTELNKIIYSEDRDNIYFAKVKNVIIQNESSFSEDINLISELKNAFGNEIIKTKNISINNELINGLLSQYK